MDKTVTPDLVSREAVRAMLVTELGIALGCNLHVVKAACERLVSQLDGLPSVSALEAVAWGVWRPENGESGGFEYLKTSRAYAEMLCEEGDEVRALCVIPSAGGSET